MELNSTIPSTYDNDSDVNNCNMTSVISTYSAKFPILPWLNRLSSRIYFPVGLLGSTLTILTLLRMRPWKIWNVYVVVLAVSDSLVLLLQFTIWEIFYSCNPIGISYVYSPESCKFILFFGITFREFSHWVIVCMTVERFFAIWFPLRISGRNVRRAYRILLLLAVLLTFHNIAYFWISGDQWNPVTGIMCKPVAVYEDFVDQYWKWIRTAVIGIVPLIIVFFANVFIVTGWILSNRRHRELTRTGSNPTISVEDVYKHVQVTAMITAVSGFFTLAVLPHAIFMLTEGITYIMGYCLVYADLNYCSNFFLYLATSKEFRKQMKQMFCKLCTPCNDVRNTWIPRLRSGGITKTGDS